MLLLGNCLDELKKLDDCSVDAVVTDPPYGLNFMGKKWDYDVPSTNIWCEVLRVLKPGGHLLSFFGTRTYHRGVVRIEDAGFEIRDQIQWIYGSGFPKSLNLKDEWQGWGTALKPANEPIVLARKPLSEKTVADNVLKWGCGAINVDGSRIETSDLFALQKNWNRIQSKRNGKDIYKHGIKAIDINNYAPSGRWPANVMFDEQAAFMLDEQSGESSGTGKRVTKQKNSMGYGSRGKKTYNDFSYSDSGGASRFFYCAKASKSERNAGLDQTDFVLENDSWEKQDLKLALMDMLQLVKDTSEDILMDESLWSTGLYGHSISEQYPKGMIFIIKTVLKLITELKTLSALQSSNIKENIQDAIKTIEANGLNLVESVEFINQLDLNTTNDETAYLLGVVRVVLPMLLKIKGFAKKGNFHSTVKPIKLMEYLIKLITPSNGIVLDPFMGSGSTGVAAKNLKFNFIGIELNEEYFEIAKKRIENG